jgi:putative ABC transport system permease protein
MRNRVTLGRLIRREMQRAKLNTALCLAVVTIAAGLFVAMMDVSVASVDATRVMMKEMGFNLLVTPQGVDPARYQALDFQDIDMPEEYTSKLASNRLILAQHFVGKYQKTVPVDGCTAVLTGVLAEVTQTGTEKKPMPTAYTVPQGKVFLGSAVAQATRKNVGDTIAILGKPFEVAKVLDAVGAIPEDIRIYAYLHDVQQLVGRPGRINAIDALACQCPVAAKDVIAVINRSIQETLPDVNVQPYHSILLARHQQRILMQRLELVALAIVMLGSAAAIWGLTYQNVSHRRHEIGVLRALGVSDGRIYALFVGKILLYGVTGAALGCALGRLLAMQLSVITTSPVVAPPSTLAAVMVVTPLAAVLFGLPPILTRLLQEPIQALGEGES